MALGLAKVFFGGELGFGLHTTVAANVYDGDTPFAQHAAHQQPPMTIRRILLAAEDRHARLRGRVEQPLDPLAEAGRFGQSTVEYVALVVKELLVVRVSTQRIAEKPILDCPIPQCRSDCLAVELRSVARIGTGPNVDHDLDPALGQQAQECLQRMVGVPDRPYGARRPQSRIMHDEFTPGP